MNLEKKERRTPDLPKADVLPRIFVPPHPDGVWTQKDLAPQKFSRIMGGEVAWREGDGEALRRHEKEIADLVAVFNALIDQYHMEDDAREWFIKTAQTKGFTAEFVDGVNIRDNMEGEWANQDFKVSRNQGSVVLVTIPDTDLVMIMPHDKRFFFGEVEKLLRRVAALDSDRSSGFNIVKPIIFRRREQKQREKKADWPLQIVFSGKIEKSPARERRHLKLHPEKEARPNVPHFDAEARAQEERVALTIKSAEKLVSDYNDIEKRLRSAASDMRRLREATDPAHSIYDGRPLQAVFTKKKPMTPKEKRRLEPYRINRLPDEDLENYLVKVKLRIQEGLREIKPPLFGFMKNRSRAYLEQVLSDVSKIEALLPQLTFAEQEVQTLASEWWAQYQALVTKDEELVAIDETDTSQARKELTNVLGNSRHTNRESFYASRVRPLLRD